jgi:hypothetical protein
VDCLWNAPKDYHISQPCSFYDLFVRDVCVSPLLTTLEELKRQTTEACGITGHDIVQERQQEAEYHFFSLFE